MKILKKSLAIFLTLALCLSAMLGCLSVSAEGTDPAIEIAFELEDGKVAPGEQFEVAIEATNFAAVKGAKFDVNFGTLKIIEVVSSDFSAIVPDNENGAEPTINVVDDHNVRYVDTFAEIEGGALLVVKVEAVDLGATTITVSNVEIGLSASDMLTPAEITAGVVVEEEVVHTHEYVYTSTGKRTHTGLCACDATVEEAPCYDTTADEDLLCDVCNGSLLDSTIQFGKNVLVESKVGWRIMLMTSQVSGYYDYTLELKSDHYEEVAGEYFAKSTHTDYFKFVEEGETLPEGYRAQSKDSTSSIVCFDYKEITAYELTSNLSYTVYFYDEAGNLVAHSKTETNTVAERIRTNSLTNTAADAIFVDLMNYGAAVQTYFVSEYPTSELADAKLPTVGYENYQKWATDSVDADDAVNINNGVAEKKEGTETKHTAAVGKNFKIEDSNIITFMVNPSTHSNLTLKIAYTDSAYGAQDIEVNLNDLTPTGGIYYFDYPNVALYDTNATVTATLYQGDTLLYTRIYSVASYVKENANDTSVRPIGDAIMRLTVSVRNTLNMN